MRKYLLGLLATIIVLILLLPYFLGHAIESELKYQLQFFNQTPNRVYASVIKYDTHWFHTDTTALITQSTPEWLKQLTPDSHLPNKLIYQAKLCVYHGPVTYLHGRGMGDHEVYWGQGVAVGTLKLISPLPEQFSKVKGLAQPIQLFATVTMLGDIHLILRTNQYKIQLPGPHSAQLLIEPARLSVLLKNLMSNHSDIAQVKGSMQVPAITSNSHAGTFQLHHLKTTFNLTEHPGQLWTGNSSFAFKSAQMANSEGHQTVALKNFKLNNQQQIRDKSLELSHLLTIDQLTLSEFDFHHIKGKLIVSNLNQNLIGHFKQAIRQALSSQEQDQAQQRVINLLPFVLKGTDWQLKTLQADTPQGFAKLTGQAEFPKKLVATQSPNAKFTGLLNHLTAQLNITLPAHLLQQSSIPMGPGPVMPPGSPSMPAFEHPGMSPLATVVNAAYEKGYLTKQENKLVSSIQYKQGRLSVNNKPIGLNLNNQKMN